MQEFLTYLVTNIVKNPADVRVDEVVDGNTYVYNINVNADDMGLVIGKQGRIIKSVRALAKSKAIKEGVMIRVELVEPEGGKGRKPREEDNSEAVQESADMNSTETAEVTEVPEEEMTDNGEVDLE